MKLLTPSGEIKFRMFRTSKGRFKFVKCTDRGRNRNVFDCVDTIVNLDTKERHSVLRADFKNVEAEEIIKNKYYE